MKLFNRDTSTKVVKKIVKEMEKNSSLAALANKSLVPLSKIEHPEGVLFVRTTETTLWNIVDLATGELVSAEPIGLPEATMKAVLGKVDFEVEEEDPDVTRYFSRMLMKTANYLEIADKYNDEDYFSKITDVTIEYVQKLESILSLQPSKESSQTLLAKLSLLRRKAAKKEKQIKEQIKLDPDSTTSSTKTVLLENLSHLTSLFSDLVKREHQEETARQKEKNVVQYLDTKTEKTE